MSKVTKVVDSLHHNASLVKELIAKDPVTQAEIMIREARGKVTEELFSKNASDAIRASIMPQIKTKRPVDLKIVKEEFISGYDDSAGIMRKEILYKNRNGRIVSSRRMNCTDNIILKKTLEDESQITTSVIGDRYEILHENKKNGKSMFLTYDSSGLYKFTGDLDNTGEKQLRGFILDSKKRLLKNTLNSWSAPRDITPILTKLDKERKSVPDEILEKLGLKELLKALEEAPQEVEKTKELFKQCADR